MTDSRIDEATRRYDGGEFQTAIEMLLEVIDTWPRDAPPGERQRAQLYLATMYRTRGDRHIALELLTGLEKEPDLDPVLRPKVLLEQAKVHRDLGDLPACSGFLRQAEELIDFTVTPETDREQIHLLALYHTTCGRYSQETDNPRRAIEHFLLARDHATTIGHRVLVNLYLNLANSHAVLGERDVARDYLSLAFAALKSLDSPYAYGLVHYFETLATFNLFVYDSREKAIDCLSKISEKMVDNFDDFKRIFDFFGEVLVQHHEGRFDLEKLKRVRDYYDNPLIQAYLPSLIAGAPRPGEEVGKDEESE